MTNIIVEGGPDKVSVVVPPSSIKVSYEVGRTGRRGSIWFAGSGAPGPLTLPEVELFVNDMYMDNSTGDVYQYILLPNNVGDWSRVGAVVGGSAGSGGGAVAWSDVTNKPTQFTPSAHKASHATGGTDALTPSDIGAQPAGSYAPASHTHPASAVSDSTTTGRSLLTAADAAAARTAIGAGTSNLAIGTTGTTAASGNRQATESAIGMIELATTAEVTAGTDTTRAVTPAGLKAGLDTKADVAHSHTSAQVTDFTEAAQDVVGAMVAASGGSYNDAAGTFTMPAASSARSVVPQLSTIGTKLLTGQSVTLGVASDSTADMIPNNGAVEWPRRLCDTIAAARPSARVQLHNWSDATQTYETPTVVQAGDATSATLIDDGFGRVSTNLIGSTADTVGVWGPGNGTPTADGSVANLPPWAALSVATPQQASSVTATLKVVTEATTTQQLRLAVAMTNSGLSGYGVYAMLQINTGGTQHYLGIRKTTPSGSNVDVVPLALQSLGLVSNSPTAQDATMVLDLTGTTVTLTVTVGDTTTTISGTVPQADLDTMGFHAGALGWAGTTAFRLDRLQVALPAADVQTVNVYNGSRAGSTIGYQGTRAAAMYGSGVTGTIDALIVASGINNTATTPSGYSTLMTENVALIEAQQPTAGIVLASQNPLYPPVLATGIARHGDRTAVLRGLAAANGWGYLPVFEAFTLTGGTLTSDGTHPNDEGSALWADVAWGAMALIAPDSATIASSGEPGIPVGATLDDLGDSDTRKAVTPAMEARIDAAMQAAPDATMTRFRGAVAGVPANLVAGDWWIDTTVVTP